jgi:hypothetical protein
MKSKLAGLALALAVLAGVFAAPLAASAQDAPTVAPVPVSASEHGRSFEGTWTLTRFVVRGHQLLAEGTLAGEFTNPAGHTRDISRTVRLPVTVVGQEATSAAVRAQAASCELLHLVLGPLHLRLLGLHLDTNQIIIDLTGVPSEGLLGSLLCGLLAGGTGGLTLGQLQQLVDLLNQLLGLLG